MEVLSVDIPSKIGEVWHLTPIGDVHADATASDKAMLRRVIDERRALPNSLFIGLGDLYEWIMTDDHRYSRANDNLPRGGNNEIDKMVAGAIKHFGGPRWLAMACGNHCMKVATKYHTDPMERIAEGLGVPYAGYAGRLTLRFISPDSRPGRSSGCRSSLRVLFHHGAWGGDASAGFSGAMRWARGQSGWDVFLYGHNHQSMVRSYDVTEQAPSGRVLLHPQHVIACGTFLKNGESGMVTYSEKAGYGPVFVGCSLIRIRAGREDRSG